MWRIFSWPCGDWVLVFINDEGEWWAHANQATLITPPCPSPHFTSPWERAN